MFSKSITHANYLALLMLSENGEQDEGSGPLPQQGLP